MLMKSTWITPFIRLYAPAFLIMTAVIGLSDFTGREIGDFTRDPATVMAFNPFIGLLSNLGILVWSATASCCFFAAAVLKTKDREITLFLFFSGLLTTLLLFDDFFLFHEKIWVKLFNVEEMTVFLVYSILTLICLFRFRKLLIKTDLGFLILAFGFFSTSIAVDFFFAAGRYPFWHYLFEDGLKFFGIISWFHYFTQVSLQTVILEQA